MSKVISSIKGIILTHMTADPLVKEAVLDIINKLDIDLETCDFDEDIMSEDLEDAILNLDKALIGEDDIEDTEIPQEPNEVIRTVSTSNDDESNDESPKAFGE